MTTPLLQTRNLKAGYLGREVVRAVNIEVRAGEVVCLLGPNGAGKTTTLLTIAGELAPMDGIVMVNNVPTWTPMHQRVRDGGIGLITEERLVFTKLSAYDNLRLGGGSVDDALELFPELRNRLNVRGGVLSGGEQSEEREDGRPTEQKDGDVTWAAIGAVGVFVEQAEYNVRGHGSEHEQQRDGQVTDPDSGLQRLRQVRRRGQACRGRTRLRRGK